MLDELSNYKFFILDSKKIGLFPREKFIFKALLEERIKVNTIYKLIPFRFWSNKSLVNISYFFKYFIFKLFGKNYLTILIKKKLIKNEKSNKEINKIIHILNTSLIDSTNKATNSLLTKNISSFLLSNIKWRFRYALFASNLCSILSIKSKGILELNNTCFVIGDIFYAHETILSVLLLFRNGENSRNNTLFFYSGFTFDSLYHAKNIHQLRASAGPYGSNDSNNIYKNANLKTNKYLGANKENIIFDNFVLYPPCISDTYFFTEPNTYFSQYDWANDIFEIYSGKTINIKMHPAAIDYGDRNYWLKLFKNLSRKYNVKINYLETSLCLDDILNSGFYPLSPKGTVGLELILREMPSLLLESNHWSSNFPELTVYSRNTYRKLIKKAVDSKDLNSILENFRPSEFHISLAHSIYEFDEKDFYYSIGINKEGFPDVPFGKKNRIGKNNILRDRNLEKVHLSIMDSKKSKSRTIEILNKMITSKI